jgi:hypothetical protein
MLGANDLQMAAQIGLHCLGQERYTILFSLAPADNDLV